jgi:hypothetical protein
MVDSAQNLALLSASPPRGVVATSMRSSLASCPTPPMARRSDPNRVRPMWAGRPSGRAVAAMFARDADIDMSTDLPVKLGDTALLTWTYRLRMDAGAVRALRGCDTFRFKEGKIILKDAFRKTES